MSLEAKIEVLSEQITQLTDAITVLKNVLLEQGGQRGPVTFDDKVEFPKVTSTLTMPEVPNVDNVAVINTYVAEELPWEVDSNVNSSAATGTSPASSKESRTVTYDDVKNVTIAVSKIDKAKAVAGLARFGVATAKVLNESQWLDYVVYMGKVAAGEVDPESPHE